MPEEKRKEGKKEVEEKNNKKPSSFEFHITFVNVLKTIETGRPYYDWSPQTMSGLFLSCMYSCESNLCQVTDPKLF